MVDLPFDRAAVVVPTRDRAHHLARLVPGLVEVATAGHEVVVVDSASKGDDAVAPARDAGLTVVRAERPGASHARNLGAAHTRAPIVVFTDDDCVPRPGWVDGLRRSLADPRLAFVAGAVLADRQAGSIVSVTTSREARSFVGPLDPSVVGHAANLAVRREWLEKVGGWDEALGAGGVLRAAEDQDLVLRMLLAGATGRYEPDAAVVHRQWRSTAQALRLEYAYGIGSGGLTVKALRLDRRLGRQILRTRLVSHGLLGVLRNVVGGHPRAAAHGAVRLWGTVVGLGLASAHRVVDGRFAPRRRRGHRPRR